MTDGLRAALVEAIREAPAWPFGLYVHIPYCPYRCPYCDFNAYRLSSRADSDAVVEAILREAEAWAALASRARGRFRTLFLGGGTPTVLTAEQIGRLLPGLRQRLPCEGAVEVTVEANPGTLTPAKVEVLLAEGVNRVSLGVQSLDAGELQRLGRLQTPDQVRRSVRLLRQAGVANLNVDLIFAIPGQTPESLRRTLECALDEFDPEHVSAYCLTVEEGTPFHELHEQGRLVLPDVDAQAEMYRTVVDHLARAGLMRYEVSNFARKGCESEHNLNYWRHGNYLGLGPGAHSFWEKFRFATVASPPAYAGAAERFSAGAGASFAFVERLTARQLMDERIMLGLRLAEGVDRLRFYEDFGCWPEEAYPAPLWDRLEQTGLILREAGRIRLTDEGFLVADAIIREIAARGAVEHALTGGASTPERAR